ncbi:DNA-directed RNA polymerase I, subunit RPA34.5 [Pilobolus umbonatus]|nr:DNA-directed RNA polymerase I, subunit RPA34.5 [Pilobolus umbonatus]
MSSVPEGFKHTVSKFSSAFDKEIIADDDKELWLIRVPANISEQDLANMDLKKSFIKKNKSCSMKVDKVDYVLNKVPTKNYEDREEEEKESAMGVSGQEMLLFDCLVPSREQNGDFTFAPKPFDQHLILSEVLDIPTDTSLAESIRDTPVYKREQPEGLKMRFMPTGYYSGN